MNDYIISINQLANFRNSSEKARRRIIAQQLSPDKFRIPWYQLTKARVKKSLESKGDLQPIFDGIDILKKRNALTNRQKRDKQVSLEALERFVEMQLPKFINEIEYSTLKPNQKVIQIEGVSVVVSPDIIIKGTINGKTVYGAVKIHISKGKPFDFEQSKLVSHLIYQYLINEVADDSSEVIPEFCLSLDIFGNRITSADKNDKSIDEEIKVLCLEFKNLWKAA